MRRRIAVALAVLICVFGLLAGAKDVAYAKENTSGNNAFFGNMELLKQEDDNYVIQVTVVNKGEDFSGLVQLVFASSYADNTAYNTEITLPAQGKKQFTVTVTGRAVDTVKGNCTMNFLDEEGQQLQSISFKNVFGALMSGITVGILSDNYDGLSYMDAGGADFYIRGNNYSMQLVELDQDNLRSYLDGLYFLVIDQFNVSSLSQEDIQAIQDWVKGGGWLIIGTGAYAEQTLSGFDDDFLDLDITEIHEPGEESTVYANAQRYGYYYSYIENEVDFADMTVAELNYNNLTGFDYESSQNPAIINSSHGDGAVAVYFFSFGDQELQKLNYYAVQYMYEELMYQSGSYQSFNRGDDMEWVGQRALARIDQENTDVDFSGLKVLIAFYVVLAGPVLYLILRKCRKSEWYWIGVPALGLAFILVVFVSGQGARVKGTNVYSVTVQRTDSTRMDTYFLAYHSGTKPWNINLRDDYEVGGPGWSGYYNYYSNSGDYTYIVTNDSQGMSVGLKPHENFESGYLYAGGKAEKKGAIIGEHVSDDYLVTGGFTGTVTNATGYDLAYMAVWHDSHIWVYENVKAGETISLQQAQMDSRCVYENMAAEDASDLMYSMVYRYYNYTPTDQYRQDDMAALLIGLGVARDAQPQEEGYGIVAVAVYFFSFGDQELQKLNYYAVQYMYEELMYQSGSYQSFNRGDDMEWVGQRALARIDQENTDVDFSGLKVLIAFYVVLAGPVLYLILRKCRKSEWYWIGVPALGLAFILVVFVSGQGARVKGTNVYSVTVQRTDSTRMDTYFLAYHSGTKPWNINLRDDYEVGGPGWSGYYNYYSNSGDYTYIVTNDSQGMSVGLKPHENFESGYLYAGGKAEKKGAIIGEHVSDDYLVTGGFTGTVTNATGYDLAYMAVWHDSHIWVYENVKAGETISLQQAQMDSRCVYENMAAEDASDLMYSMVYRYYNYTPTDQYRQDDMAALLIGLGVARDAQPQEEGYGIVAGVIRDYDKAVVSKCNETAYGCLYNYVKLEVD